MAPPFLCRQTLGPTNRCCRFEVPTPPAAANSVSNFKSKSGSRDHRVASALCFRSWCQSMLRCITNFGNGALAYSHHGMILPLLRLALKEQCLADDSRHHRRLVGLG